ncbi:hypothetical protein LPC08_17505 [Roseomonas sp. OT10]|uniref:hypothetical protein n=1 Tax=Roseomonas cutis TaxID=2897332 RepID=UPI001E3BAB94|nr:hypothetical protein [Roseomonas sp. OT10]UFN47796.1 hypothetical protein LPC08_17505 [Roseomonas sp. OT10]
MAEARLRPSGQGRPAPARPGSPGDATRRDGPGWWAGLAAAIGLALLLPSGAAQAQVAALDRDELTILLRHIAPCRRGVAASPDALLEMEVQVDGAARVVAVRPAYGRPPMRPAMRPLYEDLRDAFRDPRCNPLPLSRQGILALNRSVLVVHGRMLRMTAAPGRGDRAG